eukprot:scaffold40196_cov66-Phaeocystis_antarctica.AAC.1
MAAPRASSATPSSAVACRAETCAVAAMLSAVRCSSSARVACACACPTMASLSALACAATLDSSSAIAL